MHGSTPLPEVRGRFEAVFKYNDVYTEIQALTADQRPDTKSNTLK